MLEVKPFAGLQMDVLFGLFRDYVTIGGMPEVVNTYIKNKNFSGTLGIQKQLLKDYEEDITKYVEHTGLPLQNNGLPFAFYFPRLS